MRETLSNFLIDLASDPSRLASFTANPDGMLADAHLNHEERDALLSGDAEELRAVLAAPRKGSGKGVKTSKKKKGGGRGVKKTKPKPRSGGGGVKMSRGRR
jgi:hypothetical protein